MKRFAMALLLGAFATTALAADARYFVVTDTVGNCSVVDSKPGQSSGLKIVGDKGGYSSSDAASKVLKDMTKKMQGRRRVDERSSSQVPDGTASGHKDNR
jgi:hypothetical protein